MEKRWQDVVTLLLGLWLVVSPFMFPRTIDDNAFFISSIIVGVLLILAAIAAILRPNAWKEWIVVILGSWLVSSAYFLGSGVPVPNEAFSFTLLAKSQFFVGLLVLVDATFGLYRRRAIRDMDKPKAA